MLNFKQLLKLLEFMDLVFMCQRNDQTQAQSKSRVFRKKKKEPFFCGILEKSKAYLHSFWNQMLNAVVEFRRNRRVSSVLHSPVFWAEFDFTVIFFFSVELSNSWSLWGKSEWEFTLQPLLEVEIQINGLKPAECSINLHFLHCWELLPKCFTYTLFALRLRFFFFFISYKYSWFVFLGLSL